MSVRHLNQHQHKCEEAVPACPSGSVAARVLCTILKKENSYGTRKQQWVIRKQRYVVRRGRAGADGAGRRIDRGAPRNTAGGNRRNLRRAAGVTREVLS